MVLHTRTRELLFHPHVRCIVSDDGLTNDSRWAHGKGRGKFLFPVKALSVVFRAKFLEAMTAARSNGKLSFGGSCASLAEDESYEQLCKSIASKSWNVYAKRPFKRPEHVFEYLGRYTHRVGISNHRLLFVDNQSATSSRPSPSGPGRFDDGTSRGRSTRASSLASPAAMSIRYLSASWRFVCCA